MALCKCLLVDQLTDYNSPFPSHTTYTTLPCKTLVCTLELSSIMLASALTVNNGRPRQSYCTLKVTQHTNRKQWIVYTTLHTQKIGQLKIETLFSIAIRIYNNSCTHLSLHCHALLANLPDHFAYDVVWITPALRYRIIYTFYTELLYNSADTMTQRVLVLSCN